MHQTQHCPQCGVAASEASRFCQACGESLAAPSGNSVTQISSGSVEFTTGRFVPGEVIAGRYRIISLLGVGGMGEVFRADDLKLGQPVALKFLPASHERDPMRLERLLHEVRTARQISHPNVCRVYDIGDVNGRHFLSMEFIEGEDLASLLRRIGRLPHEKAVELGTQIASGISAAHDQGVLHRDLKPANIMIDHRGVARITDFGLAGVGEIRGIEAREGTPAYQAPEQLDGTEVTRRSDIYAFGLILHELLTGRRPFQADSIAELRQKQNDAGRLSSTSPIEPEIRRILDVCLDPDPSQRPASMRQVISLMPGGDPLDAAMAAGQTPSPEVVAGSLRTGSLSPPVAIGMVLLVLALFAFLLVQIPRVRLLAAVPFDLSPDQLVLRAREALSDQGITGRLSGYGLDWDGASVNPLRTSPRDRNATFSDLREGRSTPLRMFYRSSNVTVLSDASILSIAEPALVAPGDAIVFLDPAGRLRRLFIQPNERTQKAPDWERLFERAGLRPGDFSPEQPKWTSPAYADKLLAWVERGNEHPTRVVGATLQGRLVWFEVVHDGINPEHVLTTTSETTSSRIFVMVLITFYLLVVVASLAVARRNVTLRRVDTASAFRLATFLLSLSFLTWLFTEPHELAFSEFGRFMTSLGSWLTFVALILLLYAALEPVIRRKRPELLISWLRLLQGDWRNPSVGRDVLIGVAGGLFQAVTNNLRDLVSRGDSFSNLTASQVHSFEGMRGLAGFLSGDLMISLIVGLSSMVFIVLLAIVLRRYWIAVACFGAGVGTVLALQRPEPLPILLAFLSAGIWAVVVSRYGFLMYVTSHFVLFIAMDAPLTLDPNVWYFPNSIVAIMILAGLTTFGFIVATAGRSLELGRRLLPD